MTTKQASDFSFDDFDERNNPRPESTEFEAVVDRAMSRRDFLGRDMGLSDVVGAPDFDPITRGTGTSQERASAHRCCHFTR